MKKTENLSNLQSCRMLKKTVWSRCRDTTVMWIIIDTLHSRIFPLCSFRPELPPVPTVLCPMAAAVLCRMTDFSVCFHCWETQSQVWPEQHQGIYCKLGSCAHWGAGNTHTEALGIRTVNRKGAFALFILKNWKFSICWKEIYYILSSPSYQTHCTNGA